MDRERTIDQKLRVQFTPGVKERATGGFRGARRMPGPSKDGAKRASYTRGTNTRARDILLFADVEDEDGDAPDPEMSLGNCLQKANRSSRFQFYGGTTMPRKPPQPSFFMSKNAPRRTSVTYAIHWKSGSILRKYTS